MLPTPEPADSAWLDEAPSTSELLARGVEPLRIDRHVHRFGGSSGSPLVSDGADANKIFAVHVAGLANPNTGAEWNMGVLITKNAYSNIQAWKAAK